MRCVSNRLERKTESPRVCRTTGRDPKCGLLAVGRRVRQCSDPATKSSRPPITRKWGQNEAAERLHLGPFATKGLGHAKKASHNCVKNVRIQKMEPHHIESTALQCIREKRTRLLEIKTTHHSKPAAGRASVMVLKAVCFEKVQYSCRCSLAQAGLNVCLDPKNVIGKLDVLGNGFLEKIDRLYPWVGLRR